MKFVQDLITDPKEAIKTGRARDVGFLGRRVFEPDKFEIKMAKQVTKLDDVGKNKSLLNNANVIREKAVKSAQSLEKRLDRMKVTFPKREFKAEVNRVVKHLENNPRLISDTTGKMKASARTTLANFEKIIDDMPKMSLGELLRARRQFDKEMMSWKSGVFDPAREGVDKIITRELRNATNNFIHKRAPGKFVKNKLEEQHLLFSAAENVSEQALKEAPSKIKRIMANVSKKIPLKEEIAGLAFLGGLQATGVPVVSTASTIGLTAGGLVVGGKALTSSQSKQFLGALLKATDKAIKKTSEKNLVRQLRADRAAILELIKALPKGEEDE